MKALICTLITVLILFFCCTMSCHAHKGKTSYAVPVSGITLDGELDDWPKEIHTYPIEWVSPVFHKSTPPEGPEDFSASFQAGYDTEDNLLYVAVIVNDDALVTHPDNPNIRNQDVCGIYVDADHSGGDSENEGRQLYIMVPGPGKWSKNRDGNPCLNMGDTEASGMKGTFSHSGNTIIYEWEIPLFDSFPHKRHEIQPGNTIGFDFILADADGQEKANYMFWTPGDGKNRSSDLFGHLVFLESYEDLATVSGSINSTKEKLPYAGLIIEAYQEDHLITTIKTDAMDRYQVKLLPGEYTLKMMRGQGIVSAEELTITVSAGQKIHADLGVTPVDLPETFLRSMALYKTLKGYQDTFTIHGRVVRPGMDNRNTSQHFFAIEKPNRIRIEENIKPKDMFDFFSDGTKMVTYTDEMKQYRVEDTPGVLSESNLRNLGFESTLISYFIMSDDPLKDLLEGVEEVKEVGSEILDGQPTTIIEISQLYSEFSSRMFLGRFKEDFLVPVRLWIGSTDYLIRKLAFERDMELIAMSMTEKERESMGDYYKGMKISRSELHTGIEIDPVFSDKDFAFIPPEGAELVEKFGPPDGPGSKQSLLGKPGPDFTLKDTEGTVAKLSEFKGKVVLLDFWATWCGPCIQAMPHVQALYEIYKEKDVIILGINSWERDKDKVKPFLEEQKITYRILLDSNNEVIGNYGVSGIPTFFILDKKGIIRHLYLGMPSNRQIIQQSVEELLLE